jgi:hypothetical protein
LSSAAHQNPAKKVTAVTSPVTGIATSMCLRSERDFTPVHFR